MTTTSIKSFDKNGLRAFMQELGQPAYRARQIAFWLYGASSTAPLVSFEQMTDLPRSLRERLAQTCTLDPPKILRRLDSRDGSRKYLIQLADATAVETVAIPSSRGRLTVCFSTQAGCAMGCVFCATGKNGLTRSLGAGEMADQLVAVAHDFAVDPVAGQPLRITNAVAMGQGEPFANYSMTLGALRLLNDEKLLGIGARHITVSTCGLLDGIHRFAEEPEQFTLAVSLHSAVQATRDRLMPGLVNQPLSILANELNYYASVSGRRPSLEFALIGGVNDTLEELNALIEFAGGRGALNFHVNLITLNATGNTTGSATGSKAGNAAGNAQLKPSAATHVEGFAAALFRAGIDANVRTSRGADIQGACGQLANGGQLQ